MTITHNVEKHYRVTDLGPSIEAALRAAGLDPAAVAGEDLAPVDEFHSRGKQATEELVALAAPRSDEHVLDVGAGIGGTCRYVARTAGAHCTGVDLTSSFCQVAERLSAATGLGQRTRFQQADACVLPFHDDAFDVVLTEHVQMNVYDKGAFYGEIARVLKPGGRFAFHDIFQGPEPGLRLPVPWADHAAISFLTSLASVEAILQELGLRRVQVTDCTAQSLAFFESKLSGAVPTLGLHLLMGASTREKLGNVAENIRAQRLQIAQALFVKPE